MSASPWCCQPEGGYHLDIEGCCPGALDMKADGMPQAILVEPEHLGVLGIKQLAEQLENGPALPIESVPVGLQP